MPNYQAGKIYTLRSLSRPDLIYVGSTTQTLAKRLGGHRASFRYWKAGKGHYRTSHDVLEVGDEYIELVESYPCENKMLLTRREGEVMREMECVNKRIEGRTKKEWREEHKEYLREWQKKNFEDNKEARIKSNRDYYCDNKERISKRKKAYYDKHREWLAQKIECDCGAVISRNGKAGHVHTKKHQAWQQLYDFITS